VKAGDGKMAGKIKVKWYKSWIGYNRRQRESVRGLGLRRLNDVVELDDTPAIRGMVRKIAHLVKIVG
jgi:large subunit ribosomal protein L30